MHDNINTKVENLISQSKWGIVIYYCQIVILQLLFGGLAVSFKPYVQGFESSPWKNNGFNVLKN
jgi:hypothetical protein